jgi:four helix bundle protein
MAGRAFGGPQAPFEKKRFQVLGFGFWENKGLIPFPGKPGINMSKPVVSFRDLVVWQKSMDLVTEIYRLSKNFPKDELFGLTGQIRRAAVSIPSNIAEGRGKSSNGEFLQFLHHSRGSLAEVETQVLIGQNLGYLQAVETEQVMAMIAEVGRLLHGLIASLKNQ